MRVHYKDQGNLEQETFTIRKDILFRRMSLVKNMTEYFEYMLDAVKHLVRRTLNYLASLAKTSKINILKLRGSIRTNNQLLIFLNHLRQELKFYLWDHLEIAEDITLGIYNDRDIMTRFFQKLETYYKEDLDITLEYFAGLEEIYPVKLSLKNLPNNIKCAKRLQRISKKLGKSFLSDDYVPPGSLDITLFDGRQKFLYS